MWKGNFNCFLSNRPENLLVIAHFAHNVCLNVSCNNAVMSAGKKRNSFYMKLEFRNSKSKSRYFAFILYCLSLSLPLLWDKNLSQVVYKKSPLQLGVNSLKNLKQINISLIPQTAAVWNTLQFNDNHTGSSIEFIVYFAIQCSLHFLYIVCHNEHFGPSKIF